MGDQNYVVEFKENYLNKQGSLNIMHHNCRSILANDKLDNYDYFLDMLGDPLYISGFTETWLDNDNVKIALFKNRVILIISPMIHKRKE